MIAEQAKVNGYTITLKTCMVTNIWEVMIGRKTYWTCDTEKAARGYYEEYKETLKAA